MTMEAILSGTGSRTPSLAGSAPGTARCPRDAALDLTPIPVPAADA